MKVLFALAALPLLFGAQAQNANPPMVENCQVFPDDNAWNLDISEYPVDANSDAYIAAVQFSTVAPTPRTIYSITILLHIRNFHAL